MSGFLTDTLVWTGALIAFVLLARRPAAHWLGARAAYGLWALPAARLVLPPLVLPSWMAPAAEPATTARPATLMAVDHASVTPPPAAYDASAAMEMLPQLDWLSLWLTIWLVGAGIFLVRRYSLYFQMRRELLAMARPVGEAGGVRLVETPAAYGPVAFGVVDKVIALPVGFMAARDRAARDLALAHELAHHRGHDLLSNMLVQPLFALHWFNPLAGLGWRALRRDQEAACDARVAASLPRERRAAYAAVIAGFATQAKCAPRLALAAPMACPVLGDRSIVQRLRSLAMTDISARRRWSGRLLIGAAALTLPLTGSISYAQDGVAPSAPDAPEAPAAPVAPAAPAAAPAAPAPSAPPARVVTQDGDTRVIRIERRLEDRADNRERDAEERIEKRIVLRDGHKMSAEDRADFEADMAKYSEDLAEFQREMAEIGREFARSRVEIDREVRLAVAEAHRARPKVRAGCRKGQRDVTETVTTDDGETIYVCPAVAMADARKAIAEARGAIADSRHLSSKERAEALRSLEEAAKETRAD